MAQQSQDILVVHFEDVNRRWRIYISAVQGDGIRLIAKRSNGLPLDFQVRGVKTCTSFVTDLLWSSLVTVSSLIVQQHVFMKGFEALESARASGNADVVSSFEGVLSRDDIKEYVFQVKNMTIHC